MSCSIEVKKSVDVFIKICDDGDILRKVSISMYRLLRHPENPVIHAHTHKKKFD